MNPSPAPDAADRRARALVVVSSLLLLIEGALVLSSASPGLRAVSAVPESRRSVPSGPAASRLDAASPAAGEIPARPAVFRTSRIIDPVGNLDAAARALRLDALRGRSLEEAATAGRAWARLAAADGAITERELASILPSSAFILARTSPDDYVDDIRLSAEGSDTFARAYKPIARALPGSNAAGARLEAALGEIHAVRNALRRPPEGSEDGSAGAPARVSRGSPPDEAALHAPVPRGQRWIASAEDLKKTHRHALDIFFLGEGERGSAEKGPAIRSMSPGLVVAAADDWVGGEGAAKYRRGGLTPRAGNGAVIYDPGTRRYYTYFHMHDVSVRPGQWVEAGEVLGRGGNTGTNARKRGHGGHLHLEIYRASEDRALDCWELRDLVLSL